MSKSAMPVSKAANAYELLDEIATLILEEPRRYNQFTWKERVELLTTDLVPACGTVCCVAGWVDQLKNPAPLSPANWEGADPIPKDLFAIRDSATSILGLTPDQAEDLFNAEAAGNRDPDNFVDYDYSGDWDGDNSEPGFDLDGHAKRGAAHIRFFMERHEVQLKAKRV